LRRASSSRLSLVAGDFDPTRGEEDDMTHGLRSALAGTVLCVAAITDGDLAHAGPFSPTWNPEAVQAESDVAADPVLPIVESIGQASEPPRLGAVPRGASAPRLSGADGANEILFAGGIASTTGNPRLLEGLSEARDPVELLPPEPSIPVRIDTPGSGVLLLAAAALIALRNHARIAKLLRR
jgi:hypothetical protein